MSVTADTKTVLRAEGFSCPSCVTKIEKRLRAMPGVAAADVHFASARIEVQHAQSVTADDLVTAVRKAGYTAQPSAF